MAERGASSKTHKFLSVLLILLIVAIISLGTYIIVEMKETDKITAINACGDGTFYDTCSIKKPYFCEYGTLIKNSELCGCPEGFEKQGNSCASSLTDDSVIVSYPYILNGIEGTIDLEVYPEVYEYLYTVSRSISYKDGELSSRADSKLKGMNEKVQRDYLLNLLAEIQNEAETKEDQARIAISLVQNIPYGSSNATIKFSGNSVSYFRFPYQILYEGEGVCGEKVELLAFLLRELGYGTVFFYYPDENHEALGIKCPVKESVEGSGYCFIETTGPSIITETEISYVGYGKIESAPEIYLLSDGFSLPDNMEEFKDANRLDKIKRTLKRRNGRLDFYKYLLHQKLKKKYGLDGSLRI